MDPALRAVLSRLLRGVVHADGVRADAAERVQFGDAFPGLAQELTANPPVNVDGVPADPRDVLTVSLVAHAMLVGASVETLTAWRTAIGPDASPREAASTVPLFAEAMATLQSARAAGAGPGTPSHRYVGAVSGGADGGGADGKGAEDGPPPIPPVPPEPVVPPVDADDGQLERCRKFRTASTTSRDALPYLVYCNDPNAETPQSARDGGEAEARIAMLNEACGVARPRGTARVRCLPRDLAPLRETSDQSGRFMELLVRPAGDDEATQTAPYEHVVGSPPMLHDLLFRRPSAGGIAVRTERVTRREISQTAPVAALAGWFGIETMMRNPNPFGSRYDEDNIYDAVAFLSRPATGRPSRFCRSHVCYFFHFMEVGRNSSGDPLEILLAVEGRNADRQEGARASDMLPADQPPCQLDSQVLVPTCLMREETLDVAMTFFLRHDSYMTDNTASRTPAQFEEYFRGTHSPDFHSRLNATDVTVFHNGCVFARVDISHAVRGVPGAQFVRQALDPLHVFDSAAVRIIGQTDEYQERIPGAAGGGTLRYGHFFTGHSSIPGGATATRHLHHGQWLPLDFNYIRTRPAGAWAAARVATRIGAYRTAITNGRPVAEEPADIRNFLGQLDATPCGTVGLVAFTRGTYGAYVLASHGDDEPPTAHLFHIDDHDGIGVEGARAAGMQRRQEEGARSDEVRHAGAYTARMTQAVPSYRLSTFDEIVDGGGGAGAGAGAAAAAGAGAPRRAARYWPGMFVASPMLQQLRQTLQSALPGEDNMRFDLKRDCVSGRFVWERATF